MRKVARVLGAGFFIFGLNPVHPPASFAGKLSTAAAQVTDASGMPRSTFSSSERISMAIQVQNTAASASNIQFTFEVKDPSGNRRLYLTGNSAPGSTVGTARSSLSGVTVGQFYSSPGQYQLTATAALDGETVQASATFSVFSPLITLTYPPNGARDLIDQPLVFRWVSSGASSYRVSVDRDGSFFKTLFTGQSFTGFLAYPLNPTDELQRLSAGEIYHWKVEGLDAAGNVVAKSDVPFNFTVKPQSPQTSSRDLAILNIERVNEPAAGFSGAWPMAVLVKNQGGKAEAGVPVSLYVDGAAVPTSPKRIDMIDAGQTLKVVFPIRPPEGEQSSLLNASIDMIDDNLQNNRFTMNLRPGEKEKNQLRPEQVWEVIKRSVSDPNLIKELEGYAPVEIIGDGLSRSELEQVLRALKDGKARITGVKLGEEK
jgi:hypothetical protein